MFGAYWPPTAARTASGPGGEGGDAPDGETPLGGPVVIEIPESAAAKADKALWWSQERQRMDEALLWPRAALIQRELIKPGGLLEALKYQLQTATAALTGEAAPCPPR